MKDWKTVKKSLLKNREVAAEYEKLSPKYVLISQIIELRLKKGLSQDDLAQRVGTKQSAIARVESGRANPSISFLEKVAKALSSKLIIQIR